MPINWGGFGGQYGSPMDRVWVFLLTLRVDDELLRFGLAGDVRLEGLFGCGTPRANPRLVPLHHPSIDAPVNETPSFS